MPAFKAVWSLVPKSEAEAVGLTVTFGTVFWNVEITPVMPSFHSGWPYQSSTVAGPLDGAAWAAGATVAAVVGVAAAWVGAGAAVAVAAAVVGAALAGAVVGAAVAGAWVGAAAAGAAGAAVGEAGAADEQALSNRPPTTLVVRKANPVRARRREILVMVLFSPPFEVGNPGTAF